MKRISSAAVKAAVMMLSAAVFAAPTSNQKTATAGLIEDGLIDEFDTGIEGTSGLIFGGFNSANRAFEAGVGYNLTDALWLFAYDYGSFTANDTKTSTTKNNTVSKDGVNVDYTDTTKSVTNTYDNTTINNLSLGFALGHAVGAELSWSTVNITAGLPATVSNFGTITQSTVVNDLNTVVESSSVDHTTGTTVKTKHNGTKVNRTNVFGVSFTGIQTPDSLPLGFYACLNSVAVGFNRIGGTIDSTKTTTVNGSKIGSAQYAADGTYGTLSVIPVIDAEIGLKLGSFGKISTDFILEDAYQVTFNCNKNDITSSVTTETVYDTTKTKAHKENEAGSDYSWSNTLTPRFKFTIDAGENLKLVADARADIDFGRTVTNVGKSITTTTVTTTDKETGKTTKTVTKDTTRISGAQNSDVFETTITPEFRLGAVYAAKPGKLNINLGVMSQPAKMTWATTELTNAHIADESITKYTDEYGVTTVTSYSYDADPNNENNKNETKTKGFNKISANAQFYLGATWFLNENFTMDILGYAGTNTVRLFDGASNSGIFNSNMKIQFCIKY